MNKGKEFELLADLAKLLKKYGPEAFEELAQILSDKEFHQTVSDVLTNIYAGAQSNAKKGKKPSKSEKTKSLRSSLTELEEKDQERGKLLLQLFDKLEENMEEETMICSFLTITSNL